MSRRSTIILLCAVLAACSGSKTEYRTEPVSRGGIEETVRNLREISPTVYFNVPKGYESLLPYLRDDQGFREKFFARLHAMFFAGAALSRLAGQGPAT